MKMGVSVCGVEFKNPVIAASGTFGFGEEYRSYFDVGQLGGVALKAVSLAPKAGNPPPRIAETSSGILNSIGLQNPGLEVFLRDVLPGVRALGTSIIANVAGGTAEEYCAVVEALSAADGIDMIELNVSCPNVKEGCLAFGSSPDGVLSITRQVRPFCKKPLMVKLSPNTSDIAATAQAAQAGGADAVSLINTLTGMAVDVHRRRPILANRTGGLSGPAVLPVALHMVHTVYRAVSIPIIGMGGIMSGEDAVAFMLCGARCVMVGTAGIGDPLAWLRIRDEIGAYMRLHGLEDVNELVGGLE
ncbi:MAG: dihydroorotate dehydrogenase [Christensenellales bacterium]|jgi:dihydroorotate dehydrogenase (NAD+) catalytic subunit